MTELVTLGDRLELGVMLGVGELVSAIVGDGDADALGVGEGLAHAAEELAPAAAPAAGPPAQKLHTSLPAADHEPVGQIEHVMAALASGADAPGLSAPPVADHEKSAGERASTSAVPLNPAPQ